VGPLSKRVLFFQKEEGSLRFEMAIAIERKKKEKRIGK
jgi:hypothetical protein